MPSRLQPTLAVLLWAFASLSGQLSPEYFPALNALKPDWWTAPALHRLLHGQPVTGHAVLLKCHQPPKLVEGRGNAPLLNCLQGRCLTCRANPPKWSR